ncbi:hypothetical protein DDE82_005817 [Stemphylium lycopersici]|uniref:Uncharacterized protein n=1 Tax=Stemphylium lycopersici TaxID=183478 RepID=A0A364N490_STELY|nr:hypothetical protein TW65_01576 [Stemphylium lycopersici]RAR02423.1 hypothetical protein DDE82_005817 [Stemphylium lycopersici]RAR11500.1 hypothetical protein DDE83_004538 [Stemphylium lycopersici]
MESFHSHPLATVTYAYTPKGPSNMQQLAKRQGDRERFETLFRSLQSQIEKPQAKRMPARNPEEKRAKKKEDIEKARGTVKQAKQAKAQETDSRWIAILDNGPASIPALTLFSRSLFP